MERIELERHWAFMRDINMASRQIPAEIESECLLWRKYFNRWLVSHYSLGIGGIVTAVLATMQLNVAAAPFSIFAMLSLICISLLFQLSPSKRVMGYAEALAIFEPACNRYKYNPAVSFDELQEAVSKGKEIIKSSAPF